MNYKAQNLLLSLLLLSCKADIKPHFITPKNVPQQFINILDTGFNYIQDTVYYHQKPFNGIQIGYYENGDTAFVKPCYHGVEEGFCKQWYRNGQLAQQRLFINGKKEGFHEGWWPNGKKKFNYEFSNDEFNGTVKEWYENGSLFKSFHFKNGYEDGTQQLFWINGKTRSNYVIKEGRRFGLLGTKNCINVADSIAITP